MSLEIRDAGTMIRPATPDDFRLIKHMEEEIFPEDPWTDGMITEELESPARAYFIAEKKLVTDMGGHNGQHHSSVFLGYAGVTLGVDADVMTIGVMKDSRREGIGGRLLEALVDAARTAGSERVFLEVRESNIAAQKLYEKYGFEHIGIIRGYFRKPTENAVTMRLTLLSETNLS